MRKLKSLATILALSALITSTVSPARKAHAAAGLVTGVAPLVIAGGALAVGSIVLYGVTVTGMDHDDLGIGRFFAILLTVPVGIAGLAILDGEGSQQFGFKELSAADGARLGLNVDQVASYNDNLEEINLVREAVATDLSRMDSPTLDDSAKAWDAYSSGLPTQAMQAVGKVSAQAFAR